MYVSDMALGRENYLTSCKGKKVLEIKGKKQDFMTWNNFMSDYM